ncbi:polyprenyl synthetase family protein [Microbacterium gilvum]|uniref:Geranylgeranyl pyrophosphate synthase n=1 Tax=Microbacterium gilvum TaxID=1336204 RepID=A0ABP9A5B4_9MICO
MTMSELTRRDAVDSVLDGFFATRIARAQALGGQSALLWRRVAASTQGGKRVRPRLVLAAHDALGGDDHRSAAIAAAAFEVLHTALLLHDDVLDGDLVRRGRPNLAGEFAAAALDAGLGPDAATAWGEASGLLAGDLLLSGVHTLLAGIESPARADIHEIVDECLLQTAAGEHADVGFALGAVEARSADIARMMEQKTAAYSFSAPLRTGAALAGGGADLDAALDRIGADLGFLYQLRDDVLGVFGVEHRTGKTAMGDLREGKRTLLIAFAAEHPAWRAVEHLFGRRALEPDDADRLRAALVASGAAGEIERLIVEQREQVEAGIRAAGLPAPLAAELGELARLCAERDA